MDIEDEEKKKEDEQEEEISREVLTFLLILEKLGGLI